MNGSYPNMLSVSVAFDGTTVANANGPITLLYNGSGWSPIGPSSLVPGAYYNPASAGAAGAIWAPGDDGAIANFGPPPYTSPIQIPVPPLGGVPGGFYQMAVNGFNIWGISTNVLYKGVGTGQGGACDSQSLGSISTGGNNYSFNIPANVPPTRTPVKSTSVPIGLSNPSSASSVSGYAVTNATDGSLSTYFIGQGPFQASGGSSSASEIILTLIPNAQAGGVPWRSTANIVVSVTLNGLPNQMVFSGPLSTAPIVGDQLSLLLPLSINPSLITGLQISGSGGCSSLNPAYAKGDCQDLEIAEVSFGQQQYYSGYACRSFFQQIGSSLDYSNPTDFAGTLGVTCSSGKYVVTQNDCGLAASQTGQNCAIPFGYGKLIVNQTDSSSPLTGPFCEASSCNPGFSISNYSCICAVGQNYNGTTPSQKLGIVNGSNACVAAPCGSGYALSKGTPATNPSCLLVGSACGTIGGAGTLWETESGTADPHALSYAVSANGYCHVTACQPGYINKGGICTVDPNDNKVRISGSPTNGNLSTALNITLTGENDLTTGYEYKYGPADSTNCKDPSGYSAVVPITTKITDAIPVDDQRMVVCILAVNSSGQIEKTPQEIFWSQSTDYVIIKRAPPPVNSLALNQYLPFDITNLGKPNPTLQINNGPCTDPTAGGWYNINGTWSGFLSDLIYSALQLNSFYTGGTYARMNQWQASTWSLCLLNYAYSPGDTGMPYPTTNQTVLQWVNLKDAPSGQNFIASAESYYNIKNSQAWSGSENVHSVVDGDPNTYFVSHGYTSSQPSNMTPLWVGLTGNLALSRIELRALPNPKIGAFPAVYSLFAICSAEGAGKEIVIAKDQTAQPTSAYLNTVVIDLPQPVTVCPSYTGPIRIFLKPSVLQSPSQGFYNWGISDIWFGTHP